MKIVVSNPEDGKSYQKELEEGQAKTLHGKKIGEAVKGDGIGLAGYELVLTGGSDKEGFPMRNDFHGTSRKRLLVETGPGYRPTNKGERQRKSIRGNTIADDIAQVNLKVAKAGKDALDKIIISAPKTEKPAAPAPAKKGKK